MKKFLLLFVFVLSACSVENINYTAPAVFTYEPQHVMSDSATLGGYVIVEGGKDVTECGIVYSTGDNPTIADTKVVKGDRLGDFFETFSSFSPGTTYYYRAYAINEIGVGYGRIYQFTTGADAPCHPVQNNFVKLYPGQSQFDLTINNVDVDFPGSFGEDGNIKFTTNSYSSVGHIIIEFNEDGHNYPLTGEYTTDYFDDSQMGTGQAKLSVTYNNGYNIPGSAAAAVGTKFYVINENNQITVIFCDTAVGSNYILNGKFTFAIE